MHLWVCGCWCTEMKGGYRKQILGTRWNIAPLAEGCGHDLKLLTVLVGFTVLNH